MVGSFLAALFGAWKFVEKIDKKGDKKAIDSKRLTDVEAQANKNAGDIENLKTLVTNIDKEMALQRLNQETTNRELSEIKNLLINVLGGSVNNKPSSHERTI
ncbi:hypothetical protein BKI52_12490 [marine bacterium AO1-C]|nr:hypothetical protein BKI52_12490 [marine bacterium AO1-C]